MTALKILFAVIAVAAGAAAALQAASNAGLSVRIGLGGALVVNSVIVLFGAAALWAGQGARGTFFSAETPWALYLGGVFGFVIIAAMAFVFPKLGGATAIALMVLGQGAAALVIDHFGLMGVPREPVTVARLAGIALVAAGFALLRMTSTPR